jgi:hypothetical protein
MSDMAKQARAAMKAKASKMTTADPHQKVDSSTWTPPEPLNTEAKTGLRPISRRAFKKGGKVMGSKPKANLGRAPRKSGGEATQYANAKINRNVKDANEERAGIKHVGALKRGGAAKRKGRDEGGKVDEIAKYLETDTTPTPKPQPKQPSDNTPNVTPAQAERMKKYGTMKPPARNSGGRTGKAGGGAMAGAQKMLQEAQQTAGVPSATLGFTGIKKGSLSPARGVGLKKGGAAKHDDVKQDMALIKKMIKPASLRKGRKEGGRDPISAAMAGDDSAINAAPDDAYKSLYLAVNANGGDRAGFFGKADPRKVMSNSLWREMLERMDQRNAERDQRIHRDDRKSGGKAKRTARKEGGGVFSGPGYPGKVPGVTGGRIARATGGKTKGKGKTNINIVIAAGKPAGAQDMMGPPPGMDAGPQGLPIPVPPPGGGMPMGGGAPMPMPMPMPAGPAPGPAPMPRKSGGRLTAKASSYKDMTAGSGGGEGRLQKTDIAKLHKNAPAFKAGGKVYKSYKDMDAGAGSGLGRLEKTEIQKRKG